MPEVSMKSNNLAVPSGLGVANFGAFTAKMTDFKRGGSSGLHLVFDFDRTLTIKKPGATDEVTTWHILRDHLPRAGQSDYMRLFDHYRKIELSGKMTVHEARAWWTSILQLFVAHRVNLGQVESDFLARATIRPGAAEVFEFCAARGMPTVILSAGVREVIEIWCRNYDIHPDLVMSTGLRIDHDKAIVGWDENTLIHVLNKSEVSHAHFDSVKSRRDNALVVGDSLDDASMASGDRNVIRVRVLDLRQDEPAGEQEVSKTYARFDALIKDGTLYPLLRLLQLLA
jgi:HAD superfamily phosphoserine phosphatase-like hydrolase